MNIARWEGFVSERRGRRSAFAFKVACTACGAGPLGRVQIRVPPAMKHQITNYRLQITMTVLSC